VSTPPEDQHRVQHRNRAADHVDIPAQQVDPRESQVLGADHQREQEVAQHGGIDGMRKKKTIMTTPCMVKSLL
jgi:hypothetical protein